MAFTSASSHFPPSIWFHTTFQVLVWRHGYNLTLLSTFPLLCCACIAFILLISCRIRSMQFAAHETQTTFALWIQNSMPTALKKSCDPSLLGLHNPTVATISLIREKKELCALTMCWCFGHKKYSARLVMHHKINSVVLCRALPSIAQKGANCIQPMFSCDFVCTFWSRRCPYQVTSCLSHMWKEVSHRGPP